MDISADAQRRATTPAYLVRVLGAGLLAFGAISKLPDLATLYVPVLIAVELALACGLLTRRHLSLAALGTFAFGGASLLWHIAAAADASVPACRCLGAVDLGHELMMVYASVLMVCGGLSSPRASDPAAR